LSSFSTSVVERDHVLPITIQVESSKATKHQASLSHIIVVTKLVKKVISNMEMQSKEHASRTPTKEAGTHKSVLLEKLGTKGRGRIMKKQRTLLCL